MEKCPKKTHFYWLDAVRFLSAFVVLLSHSRNTFFPAYGDLPADQQGVVAQLFYFVCRLGHEAVIVFFVLSGFLVGGMGLEKLREGSLDLKEYVIARFSRVYPPLLVAVLFFLVTATILSEYHGMDISWGRVLGNLLCLQGICCKSLVSPFWSLSYEVWFYILFALFSLFFISEKKSVKVLSVVLAILVLSLFFYCLKWHYLLIWVIGALAYMVRPKRRRVWVLLVALFAFVVGCFFWEYSKPSHSISFAYAYNGELLELMIAFATCLILQQLILCEPHNYLSRRIEKFLGRCARFSYTLYLSHRIVFIWIVVVLGGRHTLDMTWTGMVLYGVLLAVTMVACLGLYYCGERYSPQLRQWLMGKLQG